MITALDLEAAAFWDSEVCLDCTTIVDERGEGDVCPHCGSEEVYSAAFLLRVGTFLEDLDDPS